MSDLVGNPEDRFSRAAAQLLQVQLLSKDCSALECSTHQYCHALHLHGTVQSCCLPGGACLSLIIGADHGFLEKFLQRGIKPIWGGGGSFSYFYQHFLKFSKENETI